MRIGCVARGRGILWAVALLVGLCGVSATAGATSLWGAEGSAASLFTDHKATGVGDLLTIVIVERAEATQSAKTSTGKDASFSIGPGLGILQASIPLVGAGGGDKLASSGVTTRGGTLSAKMTAKVIEVLPNGNLVIEGRQTITLNGENQEIVITGVIRPHDVSPDNTVLSTYVADARIAYKGAGALGDKQQPGILTRLFNWLF